jgi:RNA polymerase sigma-70 factor (ECF subfamily)
MVKQFNKVSKEIIEAVVAENMVRSHIGWMIVIARRLLQDHALAEDVVQDAFLSAFRHYNTFDKRSSLKTWLHRITVNTALMKLRKIKRLNEQTIEQFLPEFDVYNCRIESSWKQMLSLETILDDEQMRERVHKAIDKLPDTYRNVLLLRDIEGYSTKEVSDLLKISESNVKVRLHRARAALKKLIEPLLRGEVFK